MLAHLLTIIGYVAATLFVQGASHFWVNEAHYAQMGFYREAPMVAFGLAAMLIQGVILSLTYTCLSPGRTLRGALLTAWAFGAFLASYMALALAGELAIPSALDWVIVEASAAALQFTLAGFLLYGAHRFSPGAGD